MNPLFLETADVLALHTAQLVRFGGSPGLRDIGLLESAVAQPQATFGGIFVHRDYFEMAAAYLYHLVNNHPFVDGNKRTGLITALTFLRINGFSVQPAAPEIYELTMAVAQGQKAKPEVADALRSLVVEGPQD